MSGYDCMGSRQLFSTPLDELWVNDDVEYETVVVSPHNDLDRDLPRCVEFVRAVLSFRGIT